MHVLVENCTFASVSLCLRSQIHIQQRALIFNACDYDYYAVRVSAAKVHNIASIHSAFHVYLLLPW